MGTRIPNRNYLMKMLALIIAGGLLVGAAYIRAQKTKASRAVERVEHENEVDKQRKGEKYLFVWAGDQARTNADFLAVVNFDESRLITER